MSNLIEDQEEEEFMMAPGEEEAMVSMEMGTDEPALDLTQASDDEVLKVFKSKTLKLHQLSYSLRLLLSF